MIGKRSDNNDDKFHNTKPGKYLGFFGSYFTTPKPQLRDAGRWGNLGSNPAFPDLVTYTFELTFTTSSLLSGIVQGTVVTQDITSTTTTTHAKGTVTSVSGEIITVTAVTGMFVKEMKTTFQTPPPNSSTISIIPGSKLTGVSGPHLKTAFPPLARGVPYSAGGGEDEPTNPTPIIPGPKQPMWPIIKSQDGKYDHTKRQVGSFFGKIWDLPFDYQKGEVDASGQAMTSWLQKVRGIASGGGSTMSAASQNALVSTMYFAQSYILPTFNNQTVFCDASLNTAGIDFVLGVLAQNISQPLPQIPAAIMQGMTVSQAQSGTTATGKVKSVVRDPVGGGTITVTAETGMFVKEMTTTFQPSSSNSSPISIPGSYITYVSGFDPGHSKNIYISGACPLETYQDGGYSTQGWISSEWDETQDPDFFCFPPAIDGCFAKATKYKVPKENVVPITNAGLDFWAGGAAFSSSDRVGGPKWMDYYLIGTTYGGDGVGLEGGNTANPTLNRFQNPGPGIERWIN
jgi:hypothetical protein